MSQQPSSTQPVVRLARPAGGESRTVSMPLGEASPILALGFATDSGVSVNREGNDLLFSFDDGASLRVTDFFVTGEKEIPVFQLPDGQEVSAIDVLAALNDQMDLSTAAGPASGSSGDQSGGSGEYSDDAGNLIAGVDRLGSLGTMYWDRQTEIPEIYTGLEASADGGAFGPESPLTPPTGPTIQPPFSVAVQGPKVDEAGLSTGSRPDDGGATSPWEDINLPEGVTVTPGTYPGDYGTIEIRDNEDGSYSYQYTLEKPVTGDGEQGPDLVTGADSIKLPATNENGESGTVEITVDIKDDVPEVEFDGAVNTSGDDVRSVTTGGSLDGTIGVTEGADGLRSITVNDVDVSGGTAENPVTVPTADGDLLVWKEPDGQWKYTFTAKNNETVTSTTQQQFVVTVTDKDGDVSSDTLVVSVTPVTLEVEVGKGEGGAQVDEAGLSSGSAPDSGSASTGWTDLELPDGVTVTPGVYPGANGHGSFEVRDNEDGTYSYQYTLETPVTGEAVQGPDVIVDADQIRLPITDADGNTGTLDIHVDIKDDTPEANNDTIVLAENGDLAGNVLTGALSGLKQGDTNGMQADSWGADGPMGDEQTISAVRAVPGSSIAVTGDAENGWTVETEFGTLNLQPNGDFTFVANPLAPTDDAYADQVLAELQYQITDKDGDTDWATLQISGSDTPPPANLVVGSEGDDLDAPGGTPPTHEVPDPATPGGGAIVGQDDITNILVGDPRGAEGLDGENAYNLCIILDVSNSMFNTTLDGTTTMVVAKNAVLDAIAGTADYDGTINIGIVLFSKKVHDGYVLTFTVHKDDPDYEAKLEAFIEQVAAAIPDFKEDNPNGDTQYNYGTNYEAAFNVANEWLTAMDEEGYDGYSDKVVFITDGYPTTYEGDIHNSNNNNHSLWGTNQTDLDKGLNAYENLLNAHNGVKVSAVGINADSDSEGKDLNTGVLDYFDNTGEIGDPSASDATIGIVTKMTVNGATKEFQFKVGGRIPGESAVIEDGQGLKDAIADGMEFQTVYYRGNDVIVGGNSDDLIFGDSLNTASLAQALGKDSLTGWDVFKALENGEFSGTLEFNGHTYDLSAWTGATTSQFILRNHELLSETTDGVTEGHDLLIGGKGNDTIYGQEGDDVIIGGTLQLTGEGAEAALEAAVAANGGVLDTEALAQFITDNPHMIGSGSLEDGNNYLNGGSGNDIIVGGGGNDVIFGGAGDDIIFAGGGKNSVHGGIGNDIMYAGPSGEGNETTFVWSAEDYDDGGIDTVLNFKLGTDSLNFTDILGESGIDLDTIANLLDQGAISIQAKDGSHLEISITTNGAAVQTVQVGLSEARFSDSSAVEAFNDSGSTTEQALLLQQLLSVSGC